MKRDMNETLRTFDNQSVREWYCMRVHDIPNLIDYAKTPEEQARQAFDLRNKYKRDARNV